ncbi:hypothetical protein BDZ89DRAFT_964935 [Hymenopellis radicata]|nr:hypothetical protein BDZ89DRAFT_964935 [Hymenopellis radicata]
MSKLEERAQFSYGLNTLIPVTLVAALALKPHPLRFIVFFPIFGISYYLLYYTTTGEVVTDLAIGSSIPPLVAAAFDYIVLTTPQTQLFQHGQSIPAASFNGLLARLRWAGSLLTSHRGIGWAHEPSKILPPPPYATSTSKTRFVFDRIKQAAFWLLMWDIAATYVRHTSTFASDGIPETRILWKCVYVWAWAAPAFAALTMNHGLLSAVMVTCGLWDGRPFFGSFWEAYTIRRFWNRSWHQLLRRSATEPGKRINAWLSLRKDSTLGFIIILYTSFFISGWIHGSADYMLIGHHGGALKFFLAQALGITCEMVIVNASQRLGFGENAVWRMMGYIWVQFWFAMTLPIYIDPQIRAGVQQSTVARVSVVEGLWALYA